MSKAMNNNLDLRQEALIENPTPRVPICLVLDCSPSMSGEVRYGSAIEQTNPRPIDELNQGVKQFLTDLKRDDTRYSAEVAIVAFSGSAETILDFDSMERVEIPQIPITSGHGGTSIGNAINQALSLLERRKEEYKKAGVDYYQPWLVIMTDGHPTDHSHLDITPKICGLVKQKRLTIFPVGIGNGADMSVLNLLSPNRPALKLRGLRFREFFQWLGKSVTAVSQSTPGESIKLPLESIKEWGTL